mgnify:CR=1 FL=1
MEIKQSGSMLMPLSLSTFLFLFLTQTHTQIHKAHTHTQQTYTQPQTQCFHGSLAFPNPQLVQHEEETEYARYPDDHHGVCMCPKYGVMEYVCYRALCPCIDVCGA